MKYLTIAIISFTFSFQPVFAQNLQRVKIILNGYKGNFCYKTGAPDFKNSNYFYAPSKANDTIIVLEGTPDNSYYLDNGALYEKSVFSFSKNVDGSFTYGGPTDAADFGMGTDTDGTPIPQLSLKTCLVKIELNKLTLPYNLSAFSLRKGQTTTTGSVFNYISHDTTIQLIKGMDYSIDNGGSIASSAFYFSIDKNGAVSSQNKGAASIKQKNILRFNTVEVIIDPYLITSESNKPISIKNGYNNFLVISKREKITVFKYLTTVCNWNDGIEKSFFISPIDEPNVSVKGTYKK